MLLLKLETLLAELLTLDGKNRAFLKSFNMIEVMNVPKNNTIDIRKTFGTGCGLSQSTPTSVPLSACKMQ